MTLGHKLVRTPLPAVHSLLSPTSRIRLSLFSHTCALFHFLDHSYPAYFPQVAHSSGKNRGYTLHPPKLQRRRAIFLYSPYLRAQPCMSFVSPTYAKVAGYTPVENVGAPTFLIFPLIFRTFSLLPRRTTFRCGKSADMKASATWKQEEPPVTIPQHFLCYPICRRLFRP